MNKYQVIKSRKSEFENPIELIKNQRVDIIEKSNPLGDWAGWILCRTEDNEGWVPYQIIEEYGIVKEDYNAVEFDLEMGEVLIEEKELNGWIWCWKEKETEVKAWAPLNHIEQI